MSGGLGVQFCTIYCRIFSIFLSSNRYLLYSRENNKSNRYLSIVCLGFNRSSIQLLVLEFFLLHCLNHFKSLSKIHFYHKCIQRYTNKNTRELVSWLLILCGIWNATTLSWMEQNRLAHISHSFCWIFKCTVHILGRGSTCLMKALFLFPMYMQLVSVMTAHTSTPA